MSYLAVEQLYRKAMRKQVERRIRQGRDHMSANEGKAFFYYGDSAEKLFDLQRGLDSEPRGFVMDELERTIARNRSLLRGIR